MQLSKLDEGKRLEQWSHLCALLFALVYFDSLVTYFGSHLRGIQSAHLYVPLFLVYTFVVGFKKALPDIRVCVLLFIMFMGLTMGIFTAPDIGTNRFLQIASAFTSFIIGYNFFRHHSSENKLYYFLGILSVAYIAVCIIALLKILPAYFPLEVALWAHEGDLNERPAITTDQNFQVFYLFAPVLLCWLNLIG